MADIAICDKLYNSKFFCDLLSYDTDLKTVPYPVQYMSAYQHYVEYLGKKINKLCINNSCDKININCNSYECFNHIFNLCQYLDDEKYLKYSIQHYFDYLALCNKHILDEANDVIDDNCQHEQINENDKVDEHDSDNNNDDVETRNRKNMLRRLQVLCDTMSSDHHKFMTQLNYDLMVDIQMLLPYCLLSKQFVDNNTLFNKWLLINSSKQYTFANIITYEHKSKFYHDGINVNKGHDDKDGSDKNNSDTKIKTLTTTYSAKPYIKQQQHGVLIQWMNTKNNGVNDDDNDVDVNGNIHRMYTKQEYRFGHKHGIYQCWRENGLLHVQTHCIKDEYHGTVEQWYRSGQLKETTQFNHGKEYGVSTKWHECEVGSTDRQIMTQTHYHNGVLHGTSNNWDSTGKLTLERHYDMGNLTFLRDYGVHNYITF